ncbi:phage tail tip lysozyme, partial [Streptococcus pyogenes]
SKDDLEEYKEILDSQAETGKFLAYQELSNPFYSSNDDKADSEYLTVTKRYGYTDKATIDPTTTLQAKASQKLYAVMDGKIAVTTKDLKGE